MRNSNIVVNGTPGTTTKVASTNTAQTFAAGLLKSSGKPAVGCTITLEDQPIRYAFGTNPISDGGTELGHVLAADASIRLTGVMIHDFRFISKVAGSHGQLMVTMEYER